MQSPASSNICVHARNRLDIYIAAMRFRKVSRFGSIPPHIPASEPANSIKGMNELNGQWLLYECHLKLTGN
jgi:hypothetical protein